MVHMMELQLIQLFPEAHSPSEEYCFFPRFNSSGSLIGWCCSLWCWSKRPCWFALRRIAFWDAPWSLTALSGKDQDSGNPKPHECYTQTYTTYRNFLYKLIYKLTLYNCTELRRKVFSPQPLDAGGVGIPVLSLSRNCFLSDFLLQQQNGGRWEVGEFLFKLKMPLFPNVFIQIGRSAVSKTTTRHSSLIRFYLVKLSGLFYPVKQSNCTIMETFSFKVYPVVLQNNRNQQNCWMSMMYFRQMHQCLQSLPNSIRKLCSP